MTSPLKRSNNVPKWALYDIEKNFVPKTTEISSKKSKRYLGGNGTTDFDALFLREKITGRVHFRVNR
jgi:hypothetical protein